MSLLFTLLLSVSLAVCLPLGLSLPWASVETKVDSLRLGSVMEVRPVQIQQGGVFLQTSPPTGLLHTLYSQAIASLQSALDYVTSLFSDLMDSMVARTNDYVGGLVMGNLTNVLANLGFVKSVRFLAEEVEYALNVTSHNLTGIRFNFMLPNQVVRGSVQLNLKEVEEEVPRSESGYVSRPDIELPSFGVVGDYVNSVVSAVLDMLTVWQYREGEERCSEKFLCSAGLQSVRRSLLVPGLITSLSSLAISWALDDTNTILAARSGFLGQDCDSLYPECQLNLR